MTSLAPDVLLVGASVRAAAASALRAGLRPWCLDLFADSDLKQITPWSYRCPPGEYPRGLLTLFRQAPQAPWLYTGGLENYPNLIREMAELRPLWGNGADALTRVRSPFTVAGLLDEQGLPYLEVQHADSGRVRADVERLRESPADRGAAGDEAKAFPCWLRKPLRGAGGRDICFAHLLPADADPADPVFYYQQYVKGLPHSAVFLARPPDEARLLGVTWQLVGESRLNAAPFQHCGNVGPVRLSEPALATLKRVAAVLARGCRLYGIFGIDFVLDGDTPWLVEVNPRYTASVEVLEYTAGRPLLAEHLAVFDPQAPPPGARRKPGPPAAAKLVWYAARRFVFPDEPGLVPNQFEATRPFEMPLYTDIPGPGEIIEPGWPVCTILTGGNTPDDCRDFAYQIAEGLRRQPLLGGR